MPSKNEQWIESQFTVRDEEGIEWYVFGEEDRDVVGLSLIVSAMRAAGEERLSNAGV